MKKKLLQYAQYNLWANQRIISVFQDTDPALLEKEIISSFPSIKKTALHISDAETLWFSRLQGTSPTTFPSAAFIGTTEHAFSILLKSSEALASFIKAQPSTYFTKNIQYKTISYGEGNSTAADMIHHCLNHSTFHRGQLITMARQLGITKFPPLDYIYFIREPLQPTSVAK